MIDYQVDADGICTLSWNVADRPMNVLNAVSIAAFDAAVQRALADPGVRGVIVTSSRKDFVAGGDLDLIRGIRTAEQAMAASGPISRSLRRLETSGKPFVAAINGTALGGGLEICLACHRRIVADDPKIQLGLPEVGLGLLPAAGGTQRLPRLIGIAKALPYLLEGRKLAPAAALEAGIVDELVPATDLLPRARAWLLAAGADAAVQPWDAKGFKLPGGLPQSPGPTMLFFGMAGGLLGKTQGLYPAPEQILACVYDGCQVDLDTGLKIEQRRFASLATSVPTKNMIRSLFYAMGDANRLADRPQGVPRRQFSQVGILGAGMMGAALAYVCAQAGLQVLLLDTTQQGAERGKDYGRKLMDGLVAKGRLTPDQRDATLARVQPGTDVAALRPCELVIEAVFEDRAVKAELLAQVEAVMAPDALLASNTSTLSISGLAEAVQRRERFIGLHFFSPVDRMPLLEVIRGRQTGDVALAQALDFARRIQKTPIVVNDCPSFYCNRAFAQFIYEALSMVGEGVNPALIENAGRASGMPMPPLALIDDISAELFYKVMLQARRDQGEAYRAQPQDAVLTLMVETLGRIGRKAGKGFHDFAEGGGRKPWAGLAEHFPLAEVQPSFEEVRQRLMISQSVEAARCVAEGICSVRDADVGSLLGWGFPAALGGAIGQIDSIGSAAFVALCDGLAARHGERYRVPDQLREMASRNQRYHPV
ncbi:MAG: enoyl-CoA hydratase/isomerase family protein [Burkholderiaceae bacterium]|nr:enoyl-CoA hydratase/isomerase family protein [Burkholderiaceae bacterium]